DREIRFDVPVEQLELRRGEVVIDCMNSIEDTKGNNGESGEMQVTNLRMIWIANSSYRTNLTVGYGSVVNINIRSAQSRLRGTAQALYVLTKFNGSRFEFIFTNLIRDSTRLFSAAVFRAYDTSKMYRELKLRGAVMKDKELLVLPQEKIFNKVQGVWNLSADQGNLGTLFLTNVRIVWHANLAENFNVSIPYIQIQTVRVRDSKFGPALVIGTSKRSGPYVLGFRVDPVEKLTVVMKEVESLFMTYSADPVYGVEFSVEKQAEPKDLKAARQMDDGHNIDVSNEANHDALAAYYADGTKAFDREPELNPYLGLAVESLPDGIKLTDLYREPRMSTLD
ncbi:bardet-Biedl syndrome 5 protein, partial [Baffinella frigidus]